MIIQIDGVGKTNKGAHLMLIATLNEIKKQYPDAKVYVNSSSKELYALRDNVALEYSFFYPFFFQRVLDKLFIHKIISEIKFIKLSKFYVRKNVDLIIDIGGFQFGDQWNFNDMKNILWEKYLTKQRENGTKSIFLPQAFGTFTRERSQRIVKLLNQYAGLVFARDIKSRDNLINSGMNNDKILVYPDFTASVKGVIPEKCKKYGGRVCFIPNCKMISNNISDDHEYIAYFCTLINFVKERGYDVFLLNHEGNGDLVLCNKIKDKLTYDIPVVSGYNAIETKGIISISYLVISSRFHGCANALSSSVPCLATSWNHKYQTLQEEYGQKNCILDVHDINGSISQIETLLNRVKNNDVRKQLDIRIADIHKLNSEMWQSAWKWYDSQVANV